MQNYSSKFTPLLQDLGYCPGARKIRLHKRSPGTSCLTVGTVPWKLGQLVAWSEAELKGRDNLLLGTPHSSTTTFIMSTPMWEEIVQRPPPKARCSKASLRPALSPLPMCGLQGVTEIKSAAHQCLPAGHTLSRDQALTALSTWYEQVQVGMLQAQWREGATCSSD